VPPDDFLHDAPESVVVPCDHVTRVFAAHAVTVVGCPPTH